MSVLYCPGHVWSNYYIMILVVVSYIFASRPAYDMMQKSKKCDTFIMTDIIKRICKLNSTRKETALQKFHLNVHFIRSHLIINFWLLELTKLTKMASANHCCRQAHVISCWTRFNTFITLESLKNFLNCKSLHRKMK